MPKHVGLDLGTSNTRMFIKGKGIILRSPTVVTVDKNKDVVVALGSDAKKMIGKTPSNMEAYRPIRNGVVADFEVTALMLHEFFLRTEALSLFNRPVVLVSTPENCTEVEKLAVENAIFAAGAKAVGMVGSSMAAAVGAGLKVNSPRGCMIVDIGGGMTQVAVISSGGIVRSRAVKLAGEKLDAAIINNLRMKKDLYVGEMTAELLKVRLGTALPETNRGLLDVSGRNEKLKCAQTVRVGSEDIYNAIHIALEAICRTITSVLESTPPELASDISDFGIMLVGGGANINGIAELINKKTGLRVTTAKNPMDCECIGIARLIEKPSIIPGGILYKNR
ncbi:MAG: rod shape-determining protein [Clostridia bacterium]|nr:rod shape-determining protein [Clostridia bacterium]MBR4031816.1 rod shape-determining protein [Clostridia bacterium]